MQFDNQPTILLSKTYEVITPESAEAGDAEERGFVFERQEFEHEEVVRMLKGTSPSSFPIVCGEHTWFTSYGEQDVQGNVKNESIHFCRDQPPAALERWIAAIEEAGFKVRG